MYAAYQGYTPAARENFVIDDSEEQFDNNVFDTFEEAEDYLIRFLGTDAPPKGVLKLNEPYNIGGEVIEIRVFNYYQ